MSLGISGGDPRQVKAEKQTAAEARREDARHAEAPALEVWKIYVATRQAKWGASHRACHDTVGKAENAGLRVVAGKIE